jgi:hypothetical protein
MTEIIEIPGSKSGRHRFYTVEKTKPVGTEDRHSPNTFPTFSALSLSFLNGSTHLVQAQCF